MKRIEYVLMVLVLLGLSACTSVDSDLGGSFSIKGNHIHRFHATTEQSELETKVYADKKMRVLWNAGDLLSVFNQSTYNSRFEFAGVDGDNAGDFEDVTSSGLHSGNPLSNIYAVYPYDKGTKINNDGNIITLTLPTEQYYKEHSFGIGANAMVAVADNDFLSFKNLGGYLQLRLYGDNVKVSSITLRSNNGERIAGKASVAVGLGSLPTVTMDVTATDAITLVCDPPVEIGTTAEEYTDFWLVIPPITFDSGFTITVTDEFGGIFQKTTTKSLTISRSTIEWMSALQVMTQNLLLSVDDLIEQTYKPYYIFGITNPQEYDMSYAGLLITYARMTNDLVNNSKTIGYDWWCGYVGAYGYVMSADNNRQLVPYKTFYKIIKSANDIIGPLASLFEMNEEQKAYLGIAYTYRALMYHDMYNLYMPAVNKYADYSKVEGLTVPIVVSSSESEPEYKSSRAPKDVLAEFVLSDLDKAEELLADYNPPTGRYPGLAVVYGLKARMYMAMMDYAHAAEYARKAIDKSGKTPLTEAEWSSPTQAFCDAFGNNSWMWYYSISSNNMTNLSNPPGFLAGEADWGYNSLTKFALHKWIYDRINRSDFRKQSFIDPDRETYPASYYKWADQTGFLAHYPFDELPDYLSIKIRCKGGDWTTYSVGGAVDWPMMRVEEMYLIEAEAIGMSQGEDAGIAKLESFMQTYRDSEYSYAKAKSTFNQGFVKNFQEEVLFQKRVEFLGEGVGFFDAKRIRPGMITWYEGSNVIHDTMKYVIEEASPYWTLVFPSEEIENNEYIIEENGIVTEIDGVMTTPNNPDPTRSVTNDTTIY